MTRSSNPRRDWLLLTLAAGVPRLLGAFFLPNTFGDAYVYIRDIGALSTKLKAGTFAITDLYGFWLPFYQFISAVINVVVGNGFYAGKVVSAMFGIGVCLLVYAITFQLVAHRIAALLAFALIAFNPQHILNSASAMTDVPHAFFVLASLYFVLKGGWIGAAIFAALAGLTRVESWMFLGLIPLLQFFRERRVSIPAILIMLLPPLFWFWISWKAAGDWLACFRVRQQYHDWLLTQNPALAEFSFFGVLKDGAMLVSGTDLAVLLGTCVAGGLVLKGLVRGKLGDSQGSERVLPPLVFFSAFMALLLAAYLTHQQPIIFPRYGLILFGLGIPILAWSYFSLIRKRPNWSRTLLIAIVLLCVVNAGAQFVGAIGELNRYSAQRAVADYLRDHFDPNSNGRIFCDEGTVTVLSGIPADRFLTSADAPKDRVRFLQYLKEKNVEYFVYIRKLDSTATHIFSDAESIKSQGFELVVDHHTVLLSTHIWVFRLSS